jgi:hypothetical protein
VRESNSAKQVMRRWQLGLIGGLVAYLLAYLTFGALVGYTIEMLKPFVIGSFVIWISVPWVSLDVYANSLEGRSDNLATRVKGLHLPWLLLGFLFVLVATLVTEGLWSLFHWLLAGASTSYCFTRMLRSAYERGRLSGRDARDWGCSSP